MSRQPRISVGMPVYNGERYLRLAIECVLGQTYGDFEFLISDNASTDGTETICREYAARDRRIVYIRNAQNIGAAGNYNQLFQRASCEFYRWFNADDLASPNLHEKCLAALLAEPKASMAYGKTRIIDGGGQLIENYEDGLHLPQESAEERFFRFLDIVGQTNAIYGLMRRSALLQTSLMGDGRYPAADTILMAELALQGKIVEIPEPLFSRRMHEQASSWARKDDAVQLNFWLGRRSRFVMPTLKRLRALWRAVDRAPADAAERGRIKRRLLRRALWARRDITREALQAVVAKFSTTQ